MNVLPYQLGVQLGACWEQQTEALTIIGAVHSEARSLVLSARIAHFPKVELYFAWARSDHVPLLLGQGNFFHAFDVNFQASRRQYLVGRAPEAQTHRA